LVAVRISVRIDAGIVFRIRHYWEIQKVVIRLLLLILIRQTVTLSRRALAEVWMSQCIYIFNRQH